MSNIKYMLDYKLLCVYLLLIETAKRDKMDKLIKKAMVDSDIKNATELSKISGVNYQTVNNALHGKDVKLVSIHKMFDAMGFKLRYVAK